MANIKSTGKRILVNETKTARNKAIRFKVKTAIKEVDAAIVVGDKTAVQVQLIGAITEIDKAATKDVYHENIVSRRASRLTKAANAMAQLHKV